MKWYEIAVYTTDEGTELVCGALTGAGLEGFSIEESRETAAAFLQESALYWDFADMDRIGTDTPCVKTYLAALPENEPYLEAARAARGTPQDAANRRAAGAAQRVRHRTRR